MKLMTEHREAELRRVGAWDTLVLEKTIDEYKELERELTEEMYILKARIERLQKFRKELTGQLPQARDDEILGSD